MLQTEVNHAISEVDTLISAYRDQHHVCESFSALLAPPYANFLAEGSKIQVVEKQYENIAGADIPLFKQVIFRPFHYSLFETPLWVDSALETLKALSVAQAKVEVAEEKKSVLEKELREVSIRVNLFEKILIPRAEGNIKKIKVFLGDQELASIAQAKVAKGKILKRKREEHV